jgi:NADH-quinone oxidoreductase subunit E
MFLPVVIINVILLTVSVLLVIADKLLINYGQCKITIRQEDQSREFTVKGGGMLLGNLINNNVSITSSCAGKATCGYCKCRVLEGGGKILPTEEVFMSREEKVSGMRLACQVKVKNDIDIFIPDFLTTVRGIVKNKSYDPKLRWRCVKEGQEDAVVEPRIIKIDPEDETAVDKILDEYQDVPGAAVPILQRINSTFNYLPEPVLRRTAKRLHMPLSSIYRLATFYNAFSLKPKGRNVIRVCMGTSCYVKGGSRILDAVHRKLGVGVGENTEDLNFSLETVSCLGCCGQSPVMSVNDEIYGYLRVDMVDDVLHKYS